MVKSWEKFISKSLFKDEIKNIVEDISVDDVSKYDCKKLSGYDDYFRIRKGKIRIVFIKKDEGNEIVAIDTRGNIYKGIKRK